MGGLGKAHQIRSKYSSVPPSAQLLLPLQSLMFSPFWRGFDHFITSTLVSFLSVLFTMGAGSFLLGCISASSQLQKQMEIAVRKYVRGVRMCVCFLFNSLQIVQLYQHITENTVVSSAQRKCWQKQ